MPRPAPPHGSYGAYRRHLREGTEVCAECRAFMRSRAKPSAPKRAEEEPTREVVAVPVTEEGHVSRLEVLREMLVTSRETIERLRAKDPARMYLLMREQREILAEIADLQGNGQVKGVTLADQLADARARRAATAPGAHAPAGAG